MFRAQMSVYQTKSNQEQQFKNSFNYAHLILPTMLASAYLYGQKDETAQAAGKNKLDDKGKKENKIRFFGTPRQIYNYFAEHEEEDG